jgi:cytochrome P450
MATSAPPDLSDIDLTDLETFVERFPADWFQRLRDEDPCHWQDEERGRGFWSITRYDDILAVEKDPETFSNAVGGTSLTDLEPEHVEARMSLLDMDPPRHTRLRALVNKGFTPRAVAVYEDRVRGLIREIIEETMPLGRFDFVEHINVELPMRILSEIMGTPLEDRRTLVDLGDRLLGNAEPEFVGADMVSDKADLSKYAHLPFSSPAALEMFDYALGLADVKRQAPGDDVVSILLNSEIDGDRLSEHEYKLFFLLLITAGNETTRHTMSHGLQALLENRDQLDALSADPQGLSRTGAEEIIRWASALHHFRRTATRDVEVHGKRIREGDKVVIWFSSGNRDERQFEQADRFLVGRDPNRHMAFGLGGPHFCLGAHLARLEIRVWLEELAPYLPHLELDGPVERMRSNFFHGIKRIPVRYDGPV